MSERVTKLYQCYCRKTLLTECQYKDIKIDRCPYCYQHLADFKLVKMNWGSRSKEA